VSVARRPSRVEDGRAFVEANRILAHELTHEIHAGSFVCRWNSEYRHFGRKRDHDLPVVPAAERLCVPMNDDADRGSDAGCFAWAWKSDERAREEPIHGRLVALQGERSQASVVSAHCTPTSLR
jgi:hypothetical protein